MAESWREACWRAEQELAEYRGTIVPAMMDRLKEQEEQIGALVKRNLELVDRLQEVSCEMKITRAFIHEHGLEWALMSRLSKAGGEDPF